MLTVGDFEYNPANVLGNGAFAIVYEGRFKQTPEHKVAIKAMRGADRNLVKSKNLLSKEIAVLKDLNHPNIVRLYDHKITQDGVYLFMEYCNGGDLAKVLSERRTVPEEVISSILSQLSSALDIMNLQGIMHRDLKPGNILLCYPIDVRYKKPPFDTIKSKIKYKLADFGFARFLQDGIMAVTMCGSPMYMAPEVLLCKNYTITVDIWSMGVIIYQCLTGVAPFQANNPEALKAIYMKQLDPIRFPPHASKYLRDVITKMLVKNPSNRISFKNILQHPFVRGNITVDPPKRQANFVGDISNQGSRVKVKPSLAEIFSTPPKSEAPPPPPYDSYDHKANRTFTSPINTSAIPIPSFRQAPTARPDEDNTENEFLFVNHDGSIGNDNNQKHVDGMSRFFSAIGSNAERSENLLENRSRNTRDSNSNQTLDASRNLTDSGHTSSNTGICGSSSIQRPFRLSNEGYYSKTEADRQISPSSFSSRLPQEKDLIVSKSTSFNIDGTPPSAPVDLITDNKSRIISDNLDLHSVTPTRTQTNVSENVTFSKNDFTSLNQHPANAFFTRERRSLTTPCEFTKLDNTDALDNQNLYDEPPELDDDILCSSEHKEEAQKIIIVLDMCELLFDLAEQRNALITRPAPEDSEPEQNRPEEGRQGALDVISAPQRIAEQMLLYQRILQYLRTLFIEIKSAVEKRRLITTRTSCRNLRACNTLYHRCIIKLDLLIAETERNINFGKLILSWYSSVSVNKMVFHYSLDQCSAAEMDALVGSTDMCICRYKAAMSLMLGVSQHAKTPNDVRDTKECINIMRNRFIKHWHASMDSPTVEE